jgi:hypothetical protein
MLSEGSSVCFLPRHPVTFERTDQFPWIMLRVSNNQRAFCLLKWLRGLRHELSSPVPTLRRWVRNPPVRDLQDRRH